MHINNLTHAKRFDRERPDMAIFPHSTIPCGSRRSGRFTRNIAVVSRWRRWPGGSAGPAPASTASSTRCAPHGSWSCRWTASITSSSTARVRRTGLARSWARRPKTISPTKKPRLPSGLPAYVASLYEVPLLTREQEAHLFRKMNYLKYEASKLRDTLDVDRPKRRLMDRIENLYEESVATKNQIISANLRLVVSIAKRYVGPAVDFFELVSDGNLSLIRAVEKFDVSRGNRFSTYATWAIVKNFARSIPAVLRHRDRFGTSHAEMFSTTEDRVPTRTSRSRTVQRESQVAEDS